MNGTQLTGGGLLSINPGNYWMVAQQTSMTAIPIHPAKACFSVSTSTKTSASDRLLWKYFRPSCRPAARTEVARIGGVTLQIIRGPPKM